MSSVVDNRLGKMQAVVETPENPMHIAGELHVSGRSRFISDEPVLPGMCYIKPVSSPFARAKIVSMNTDRACEVPGVIAVLTVDDIPGENQIGSKIKDEPLLPRGETGYMGQPVALVVAESLESACKAVPLVEVEYKELEPVLTIDHALSLESFLGPILKIERGDVDKAFASAEFVLEGVIETGSQEHLYFESQRTRAVPGEDQEITLYSATQAPAEVQEIAARVLGVASKDITVDVRRLGGAFGGKESVATLWACLAAFACQAVKRPVELKLSRIDDMRWTGKRHPFESRYRVGFDREGKILAYDIEFLANGGAYADLTMPIIQRAVLHADNAYYIPNLRTVAKPCRTNLPPNTAFRGFGGPQGIFAIESVIERIAFKIGKDPLEIRKLNAYWSEQTTHYGQKVHEAETESLLRKLETEADYARQKQDTARFNREHRYIKQGIAIVPVKFGISFTAPFLNQGSALIHLYTDASVSVSHGGIEMGQEVNTKVAQIAAAELGVTLDRVRIESHNTKRTANTAPTAASTGADINGNAARVAAQKIIKRLRPVASELLSEKIGHRVDPESLIFSNNAVFLPHEPDKSLPIRDLAHAAWLKRVDLSAHGFYQTPHLSFDWGRGKGTPFAYFVFGCALVVVEVDILTGYFVLKKVRIIHETATTMNPAVDRGQIEGAFTQGFGWCTMEEVVQNEEGRNLADSLTTYKIPAICDLPEDWRIDMVDTPREFAGVKGSKAVGEPPFIYGEAVFFAIKNAVESIDDHRSEVTLRHPATPESILRAVESLKRKINDDNKKESD